MARDIKIRAILDDKVSGQLSKLNSNIKGFGATGTKSVQSILGNAEKQTQQILQKTGGNGLIGAAMLGAGAGAGTMRGFKNLFGGVEGEFAKVKKEFIEGTGEVWTFNGSVEQLDRTFAKIDKQDMAERMKKVGDAFKVTGIAVAAVTAAAVGFMKSMANIASWADKIDTMAQRLGIDVVAFQELQYVADRSSVSIEAFEVAYKTLARTALDADRGMVESQRFFEALGVSVRKTTGELKEPPELFDELMQVMRKMPSVTARNAIGMRLMGEGFQQLIPLLNSNKEGMAELREEAHRLGYVMSVEQVARLDEVHEAFVKLGAVWKGTLQQMAIENATLTQRWVRGFEDIVPKIGKILAKIPKIWETLVFGLMAVGKSIDPVIDAIGVSIGMALIGGIAKSLQGVSILIEKTLGRVLPDTWKKGLAEMSAGLGKLAGGAGTEIADAWKVAGAKLKKEWDIINQIWEDDSSSVAPVKKTTNALDDLLALLTKLNTVKKKEIDLDALAMKAALDKINKQIQADKDAIAILEKRQKMVDDSVAAYEMLADLAASAAGSEYGPAGEKLRLLNEEARTIQDVTEAYQRGNIAYQDYIQGLTNADRYYAAEHRQVVMDAASEAINYGMQLFDSVSGLMSQISENQMKDIDRWEERETRRIDNSLLAQEYKEVEQDKIRKKAEAKRKREFEEMKSLSIAEAIIGTAAGVVQELAKEGVYGIITGLIVAAAGAAQIATIAAETYAEGGVVPGQQYRGDKRTARVNSGEMILTREDQGMLLDSIRSGSFGGQSIDASIHITGSADASTVQALKGVQAQQVEQLRSLVLQAKYLGRWPG